MQGQLGDVASESHLLTFFFSFCFLFGLHVTFFGQSGPDRAKVGHCHALQALLRLSELFVCTNVNLALERYQPLRT